MSTLAGNRKVAFISYRRAETDALAGRIRDRMIEGLPNWEVFMDVASVDPGANFRQIIDEALSRTSVLIALMGNRWLGEGRARIHDPDDLVRYEIKAALSRNIRIIPVLVNDARMPTTSELPDDIAALTECNAVELRHSRFEDDFANLAKAIAGTSYVGSKRARRLFFPAIQRIVGGALIGLVLAISGLVVHFEATGKSASDRIGEDGASLIIPTTVIFAALIGFWRASRRY